MRHLIDEKDVSSILMFGATPDLKLTAEQWAQIDNFCRDRIRTAIQFGMAAAHDHAVKEIAMHRQASVNHAFLMVH